ncbi:MAG: hypothetical protein WA826_04490 [Silvibacterium sp.]
MAIEVFRIALAIPVYVRAARVFRIGPEIISLRKIVMQAAWAAARWERSDRQVGPQHIGCRGAENSFAISLGDYAIRCVFAIGSRLSPRWDSGRDGSSQDRFAKISSVSLLKNR